MNLGDKILNYRKKDNWSQEELAREIGVTRQTISKWELNETSPDLKQAIKLAQLFNISLDEFIDNKLVNKIEKEGNKNKLYQILIIILLLLLMIIIISIIAVFFYNYGYNKNHSTIGIICTLNNEEEGYSITYDDTNDIIMVDGSPYIFDNIYDRKKHKNAVDLITEVNNYFKDMGGYCE